MKKLSFLFAALFCLMTVNAKTIYCKTGSWSANGQKIAIWSWVTNSSGSWSEFMTHVEDDIYQADIDDAKNNCIFVRFASDAAAPDWPGLQQTGDLSIPADANYYNLNTGSWSTYNTNVPVAEVTINVTTLKIQPNSCYKVSATVLPDNAANQAITWTSNNEAVATVDANGRITALAVGTATISATAQENSSIKDECVVTVSEDDDALKSITLNFKKYADWGKVNLYAWNASGTLLGDWPGTEITNADDEGVYSYTFDATHASVSFILNDGYAQTTDRTINESACVIVEPDGNGYTATIVDCDTWAPAVIHVESLAWYEGAVPPTHMYVGESHSLAIAVNPNTAVNQNLEFQASNEGVVVGTLTKHELGGYPILKIEAIAAGTTTITLISEDNPAATLSFDLTVQEHSVTALENIATQAEIHKVIENGTLYIIRNGEKYSVMGVRVQE